MKWENYFTKTIIARARIYYQRGLVQDVEKKGERYVAQVIGSIPYNVSVWKKANHQLGMSCDCPYAKEGKRCKHMAALCMELDNILDDWKLNPEVAKKPKEPDKRVYPFPVKNTPSSKIYTCFDLSVMTKNLIIMQSDFEAAQKLVEDKKVILNEVKVGYREMYRAGVTIVGTVSAAYVDKSNYMPISINFTAEEILSAYCYVNGCGNNYDSYYYYAKKHLCKHELATLILLAEYIDTYNPGDTTDYGARLLIQDYMSKYQVQVVGNVTETVKDVELEPRLEHYGDYLYLSFKTGTNKLYVVKNLTELVRNIESNEIQKFGKKTEIDFAIHKVSEKSEDYYDYIRKIVKEEKQRVEMQAYGSRYYEDQVIGASFPMYGRRLDELFDLLYSREETCLCTDKTKGGKPQALTMREKTPQIKLFIQGSFDFNNVLKGITVSGELPEVFRGEECFYYIEGEYLNRVNRQCTEVLEPLFGMETAGSIEFEIGRKALSEFYYHIMPMLSPYVEFIEKENNLVDEYLPPKAQFRFYLDAEQDVITCDARVQYGEIETSLAEHLSDEVMAGEVRDNCAEDEAFFHLGRYFKKFDDERKLFFTEKDEEAAYSVLVNGVNELLTIGEVFCTERLKRITVQRKTPLSVGVSLESGIMNLDISSDEFSNDELLEILASYRKRKKYHRLKNGDFLRVDDENIEMLSEMMESLHISDKAFLKGNIKIPAYRALYLDKILEKNETLYADRDKHFKSLIKEFKTVKDSEFEIPDSLQKIMRNYQTVGFKWLKTLDTYGFGGILADDMGLGKTLQVISVILSAKQEGKTGTSLIISPASLIYNWQEEFARFAPEIKTLVICGNQSSRAELLKGYQEYDVLITSYDLLKRDIAEYEDKQFLYQVIDEAQYIKNHTTAAAKAVKCIDSKTKYALTGTPIENRLSELWSIFDYLMPGFLYGYETFRKEFELPITKNKDEDAGKRLKRMISPFILRRLKQDVLKDLPEKLEEVQYAKFDTKQQQLYDGQVVHMKETLAKQSGAEFAQNKIQILAELTKLRQICCDPSLLFENYNGESAKRQACMDLIKSAIEGEHRVLLFSQFTSMLALLEESLSKEGIAYYKITGSTSKEERIRLVKQFNEGNVPVFLISLKAGGTGLNLVGADVVIHYDPWWNQAVQNQATDRAHRIGQKKIVTVYKLIAKGTIEEKIVKLQESKKNLADEILSGENGGLAQLSKEELLELL